MMVAVLVLDDISQGRMTEAWSSKLFDLLETRLSGGLPTFWTSQITAREFIRRSSGRTVAMTLKRKRFIAALPRTHLFSIHDRIKNTLSGASEIRYNGTAKF